MDVLGKLDWTDYCNVTLLASQKLVHFLFYELILIFSFCRHQRGSHRHHEDASVHNIRICLSINIRTNIHFEDYYQSVIKFMILLRMLP